jgi:hypothetical protein
MRVNLFNANNPNGPRLAVTVDILHQDVQHTSDGELIYMIQFTHGISGIDPVVILDVTEKNIQKEIKKGLGIIASQLDWGNLIPDTKTPAIDTIYPLPNSLDVPIESNVSIKLIDRFPTSLIDTSTIKLTVNNIDVTSDLQIKDLDQLVTINWLPKKAID